MPLLFFMHLVPKDTRITEQKVLYCNCQGTFCTQRSGIYELDTGFFFYAKKEKDHIGLSISYVVLNYEMRLSDYLYYTKIRYKSPLLIGIMWYNIFGIIDLTQATKLSSRTHIGDKLRRKSLQKRLNFNDCAYLLYKRYLHRRQFGVTSENGLKPRETCIFQWLEPFLIWQLFI